MSPDPENAGADPSNSQSWNAYSYALNNPATNTDPQGTDVHVCTLNESGVQTCSWYSDEEYNQAAAAQNAENNGITTPVGNAQNGGHPNGNIMCGGMVCGAVQWGDAPTVSPTVDPIALLVGGVEGEAGEAGEELENAAEEGVGAVERMLGVGGGEAAAESVTAAGATAYPSEIAGYKVDPHVFERMGQDLGHRGSIGHS